MAPEELAALSRQARARLLRMHFESRIGHLGGNLSCLDALVALQAAVMGPDDRLVLSKGHSAGALYVSLWIAGKLSDADLATFHAEGTHLAGHPCAGWNPFIPYSTGSLGHGLSLAAGTALGRQLQGLPGRTFCLMSDGEWQEGSTWEALIFAAHRRLGNLTALVDMNGLQGFGSTNDVASMADLASRLQGFGVEVLEIDGHDPAALLAALSLSGERPQVLLLRTTKGKGVSFMEGRMEWHYHALNQEQYERALKEIGA